MTKQVPLGFPAKLQIVWVATGEVARPLRAVWIAAPAQAAVPESEDPPERQVRIAVVPRAA